MTLPMSCHFMLASDRWSSAHHPSPVSLLCHEQDIDGENYGEDDDDNNNNNNSSNNNNNNY